MVTAAGHARSALNEIPEEGDRKIALRAIETAEKWAAGSASSNEASAAYQAAKSAAGRLGGHGTRAGSAMAAAMTAVGAATRRGQHTAPGQVHAELARQHAESSHRHDMAATPRDHISRDTARWLLERLASRYVDGDLAKMDAVDIYGAVVTRLSPKMKLDGLSPGEIALRFETLVEMYGG